MSLAKSTFLIRDYDNIREILRDVYIFGCYSRDDFVEKGISGRKYDNEQRRLSAYLPANFIQKRRMGKKVLLYCSYKTENSSNNYLAETFRNKSFTLLDVMAYFFILQILSDNVARTLPDILEEMPNYNEEAIFTKDNLRIKLEELVEEGFLLMSKEGKNTKYTVAMDIWEEFKDEELRDIYFFLGFLKNTSSIEMPFYFLQRKLKLYLYAERGMDLSDEEELQIKHNHLFNSLDNDILLSLLVAIKQEKFITIGVNRNSNLSEQQVVPIKLVHDCVYGRQYLICKDSKKRLSIVRIDKIVSVSIEEKLSDSELDEVKEYSESLYSVWSVSGVNKPNEKVEIEFRFDEDKEKYILGRIRKEGKNGKIEKMEDNRFLFTVEVRDPREMVPWIRSFGEHAVVISSGDFDLPRMIKEDWRAALEKYEGLS